MCSRPCRMERSVPLCSLGPVGPCLLLKSRDLLSYVTRNFCPPQIVTHLRVARCMIRVVVGRSSACLYIAKRILIMKIAKLELYRSLAISPTRYSAVLWSNTGPRGSCAVSSTSTRTGNGRRVLVACARLLALSLKASLSAISTAYT